jgi:hypothetical protein
VGWGVLGGGGGAWMQTQAWRRTRRAASPQSRASPQRLPRVVAQPPPGRPPTAGASSAAAARRLGRSLRPLSGPASQPPVRCSLCSACANTRSAAMQGAAALDMQCDPHAASGLPPSPGPACPRPPSLTCAGCPAGWLRRRRRSPGCWRASPLAPACHVATPATGVMLPGIMQTHVRTRPCCRRCAPQACSRLGAHALPPRG